MQNSKRQLLIHFPPMLLSKLQTKLLIVALKCKRTMSLSLINLNEKNDTHFCQAKYRLQFEIIFLQKKKTFKSTKI